MESDTEATFVDASIATQLLMNEVYGSKNTLSLFMNLSDTNYKFTDLKMHF